MEEALVITVKELAEKLSISLPTAYELCRRKDFPIIKLGRRIIIPANALNSWLDKQVAEKVEK